MDPVTSTPSLASSGVRLPLSSGAELRVGRWFGRLLTIAATWPLGYAFLGKQALGIVDMEALLFGGPGVALGLLIWAWSGYRLRNPLHYLEFDRRAGRARLVRGGELEAQCSVGELGAWSVRTWRVSSGSGSSRTSSTWYAVRCVGLGERDLFVDLDEAKCRAWIVRAEAGPNGALPTPTSLVELVAERFDALVPRLAGAPAKLTLLAVSLSLAIVAAPAWIQTERGEGDAAVLFAVVVALLALAWRALGQRVVALVSAALAGAALLAKPWLAPISSSFMGEVHSLSPTSETHLYYLVPGVALIGVAMILGSAPARRRPVVASEPSSIEPALPQPTLPQPPLPRPPESGPR